MSMVAIAMIRITFLSLKKYGLHLALIFPLLQVMVQPQRCWKRAHFRGVQWASIQELLSRTLTLQLKLTPEYRSSAVRPTPAGLLTGVRNGLNPILLNC